MQCCLTAALLYAEALEERRTTFPGGVVRKEILLVSDAWITTSSWALREATSDLCSYDYFLLRVCVLNQLVCAPSPCNASYRTHTRLLHSGVAAQKLNRYEFYDSSLTYSYEENSHVFNWILTFD